jgi:hypothetical protein
MVQALATMPSPTNQIELSYLGGAAARVGAGETAFGDRSSPFILNLLGNCVDEDDRVPEAYRERWERLVAVKTQYDPYNLFRLNQNVQPQRATGNGRSA